MWLSRARPGDKVEPPALFHVTHYKAGSQWIRKILTESVGEDRLVTPAGGAAHFLAGNLRLGGVYPTVYVTKEEFDAVALPPEWSRFIVIRDLRDTLISLYFSLRYSHTEKGSVAIANVRRRLEVMNEEDGITMVMRGGLRRSVTIQDSWVGAGVSVIRYEDLIDNDVQILESALLTDERLGVDPKRLRRAIERSRFQRMSGGRERGQEDTNAHLRRATPGEWRERLTTAQIREFKTRYGASLIAAGYEKDLDW